MDDTRFVDNDDEGRFELWQEDERVGFADYQVADGVMTLPHTVVDPAHGGQGLGGRLAKSALDTARERGLKVKPVCSFIGGYIEKNPEYADLVA